MDIAGLVAGASQGEGLGNKFLSHIREVDAIAHVVRCFDDDDIVHVSGRVDPASDVAIINTAVAQGCDLILMASHGRRGVSALVLGSETVKVLTHTKIPVLVYR